MLLPEESVVHGSSAEPQPSNAARPQDLPALDRLLRLSAVQAQKTIERRQILRPEIGRAHV